MFGSLTRVVGRFVRPFVGPFVADPPGMPPQYISGREGPLVNQDFVAWLGLDVVITQHSPQVFSLDEEPAPLVGFNNEAINQDWIFWWELQYRGWFSRRLPLGILPFIFPEAVEHRLSNGPRRRRRRRRRRARALNATTPAGNSNDNDIRRVVTRSVSRAAASSVRDARAAVRRTPARTGGRRLFAAIRKRKVPQAWEGTRAQREATPSQSTRSNLDARTLPSWDELDRALRSVKKRRLNN